MHANAPITFFHGPQTRSTMTLILLEELAVPYTLEVLDMRAGEHRRPEYLAVNPMGKVPAIRHGDAVVTETVAIFLYLADLFPGRGLAPLLSDPQRGPYLRWMVFYAAAFEPAVIDRAAKREPGERAMSPYGDFETTLNTLVGQLTRGPWLLGDRFTALDLLWGPSLGWTTEWQLVPALPEITSYIERVGRLPSVVATRARDAELLAAQTAAAEST